MGDKLKILNVEDNPLDSELIQHALERGGLDFELTRVDTADAFARALYAVTPDVILRITPCPSSPARMRCAIRAPIFN